MLGDTAQNSLIVIRLASAISDIVPPLGTANNAGTITLENGTGLPTGTSVPKSAKWEVLDNYATFRFKTARDVQELMNISDVIKYYEAGMLSNEGTLELDKELGNSRVAGANMGKWDADNLTYSHSKRFQKYTVWILVEPKDDSGNEAYDLTATNGEELIKINGLHFEDNDETRESGKVREAFAVKFETIERVQAPTGLDLSS